MPLNALLTMIGKTITPETIRSVTLLVLFIIGSLGLYGFRHLDKTIQEHKIEQIQEVQKVQHQLNRIHELYIPLTEFGQVEKRMEEMHKDIREIRNALGVR
jgi:hypothetical protein